MVSKKEFTHMYNSYAEKLYNFVYAHSGDEILAEDITAETFTRAWNRRNSFDGKFPQAWLFAIARNLLSDHWRSKHSQDVEIDEEHEDDSSDMSELTDKLMQKEKVHAALQQLPEEMRTVVFLRFFEGMNVRDVAKVIQKKEVHVRVIQYRALKLLKEKLA